MTTRKKYTKEDIQKMTKQLEQLKVLKTEK